jgi:hypothetical protein
MLRNDQISELQIYQSLQKQTEICGTISHIICDFQYNCLKLNQKKFIFINREKLIKHCQNYNPVLHMLCKKMKGDSMFNHLAYFTSEQTK